MMRARATWREAARNIWSGTTRATGFGLTLSALIAGLLLADLGTVRQITSESEAFASAGAATLIMTAEGRVAGAACEALNAVPGVRAAGALRALPDPLRLTLLPQAPLPQFEFSAGFPALLRADVTASGGALLSTETAQSLGVGPGDTVGAGAERLIVRGSFDYPEDGRRVGLGYAVLLGSDRDAPYDECWVDSWPQVPDLRGLLLLTAAPGEEPPVVAQLNSRLGESFDGAQKFEDRLTRWAAPLAGVLGLSLGFIAIRIRRLELASALHARVPRASLATGALLETASWALTAPIIGLALTALLARSFSAEDAGSILLLGARIAVLAGLGALLGALLSLLLVREKHLFRYFKER